MEGASIRLVQQVERGANMNTASTAGMRRGADAAAAADRDAARTDGGTAKGSTGTTTTPGAAGTAGTPP
jgi:hypothetical protein